MKIVNCFNKLDVWYALGTKFAVICKGNVSKASLITNEITSYEEDEHHIFWKYKTVYTMELENVITGEIYTIKEKEEERVYSAPYEMEVWEIDSDEDVKKLELRLKI